MPAPATTRIPVVTIATVVGSPLSDDRSSTVSVATTVAIAEANATIAATATTRARPPDAGGEPHARPARGAARSLAGRERLEVLADGLVACAAAGVAVAQRVG